MPSVRAPESDRLGAPAGRSGTAVRVRDLTKTFGNGTRALDAINLDVADGERIVLLGANGSGKSTLLKTLNRLLTPTSGSIEVNGTDAVRCSKRQLAALRREVGMVFQRINLVSQLSVLSNVIHGSLGRVGSPRHWFAVSARHDQRAEAMAALERVGLGHVAGRRAEQLSGGQQQRVAIARMLMQRPRLVLADEPVAALDPRAGRQVMDLLWEVTEEEGMTMICTLHHLELARTYGNRIVALRDGRVDIAAQISTLADADLTGLYTTEDEHQSEDKS